MAKVLLAIVTDSDNSCPIGDIQFEGGTGCIFIKLDGRTISVDKKEFIDAAKMMAGDTWPSK